MGTPRRPETGRPRAAQFAPRAVYIQDGNATGCGEKVTLAEPARPGLIARARAGDPEAFQELTEPYRRELQLHCYRMLGSFQDAEDAPQDTLLAAWQGRGGFTEERASLRTWLYKITTNRCLNALRSARRRAANLVSAPQVAALIIRKAQPDRTAGMPNAGAAFSQASVVESMVARNVQ
jgi:DNA-directed RNA polymerase specialized sigma24 family protein